MLQTYLTMMTIFVIGSGVVSSSLLVSTPIKLPFEGFESRVNEHFTEFGNTIAAEIVSASEGELRLEEVTSMVIAYLTDLGNRFLRAIMTIVTDIIISMWYNPRPVEELIQEMTERFTEEFYKLFQSLFDLIVYLENYFSNQNFYFFKFFRSSLFYIKVTIAIYIKIEFFFSFLSQLELILFIILGSIKCPLKKFNVSNSGLY